MNLPSLCLEGKVAVVTGGKRGIGKAIALGFARAGSDVVICSRVVEDGLLEGVAKEIEGLGRHCLAIQADVTRKADVDNLVQRVIDRFGVIDILVNNAAVRIVGPLLEHREEDWDTTINTNLKGCFLCCQAVGKRMVERKKGNIINISSKLGIKPIANRGAYPSAKAGLIMLTRQLAIELAPHNIRVNAISPGWIKTEMSRDNWSNPEISKQLIAMAPMNRWGEPIEVANAALFLASDASSYITGITLAVDGGVTAG